MKKENDISRRSFLKSSALVGAAGVLGTGAAGTILTSCNGGGEKGPQYTPLKKQGEYYIPELPDKAPDGKELKAGLIGCGGRGTGAAINFLNAANGVTIVALADTFKDRLDSCADHLKKEKGIDIPADKRYIGLDAYKKLIDEGGVDVIIDATPPLFRPYHFQYAIEKGKHAFLEKPICVDAKGYRTIIAASKMALAKGLSVVTGTQRNHQRSYVEAYKRIMDGMIGEITGGNVYWNGGMLWYKEPQPGWSDCEAMIRDWVNWKWLSGDHIVEQHVHNIDVFTWMTGLKPVSALGFGSRQRRVTGDQYDNFSVDFTMENGIHLHSMCRQISGCSNNISEFIQGAKGTWYGNSGNDSVIKDLKGNVVWEFDKKAAEEEFKQNDPYVLEHVNWIQHIRANQPIVISEQTAISNMSALMGRESAYTGKIVTWDEMTASQQDYMPADISLTGRMDKSKFVVQVPGTGR